MRGACQGVSPLVEGEQTFNVATGVSILTLFLATVFGPFEAFLKTTNLDVQQWLICTGVALSIIVVSEIRKAIRRRSARESAPDEPSLTAPAAAAS